MHIVFPAISLLIMTYFVFFRRLAKSTLLLIPLFGVNYVVFVYIMEKASDALEKYKIFFDLGIGSFQVRISRIYSPFLTENSHLLPTHLAVSEIPLVLCVRPGTCCVPKITHATVYVTEWSAHTCFNATSALWTLLEGSSRTVVLN